MSAGIIIGILAFLGFLAFIGYSIYNIESDTDCNSSGCVLPGGNWLKNKCTCSCNPGYEGVNCQTKKKHVSDLETACKDKTGKPCVDCLKTNITKNLSGSGTDVQKFKDDFISSITTINNICCQKNCSNTSGTACNKCVSDGMQQLEHIKDDTAYFMNDKGCFSFETTGQPQNFISKENICKADPKTLCIPNPCKNKGTCSIINEKQFKCTCPKGPPFFDGPTCSKSCKKEVSSGDCRKIKGTGNCKYYYNNNDVICSKTWMPGYDCAPSQFSANIGSDKCK